jgi:hypothetical protein
MEYIIYALVGFAVGYLTVRTMRKRRRAWEERKRKFAERAAAIQQDEEAMRKALAANLAATVKMNSTVALHKAQAQAKAAADRAAEQARYNAAQAILNRQQFGAQVKAGKIRYNAMKDWYEDAQGNVVAEPHKRMDADRAFFNPASFGMRITRPELVGARISTVGQDDDEQEARRRRAVEAAMVDAQLTGLGVVRVSDMGSNVEHIPAATFRGGGGSFDGGGASGDYTPSEPSSSPSPSHSSSDSGSSSSSSDSGGSSGGSSD